MIRQFPISAPILAGLLLIPFFGARAAPIVNLTDHPILTVGKKLALEDIRKNIILAGLKRHWHMSDDGPGKLKALQESAKQTATVSITYTTTTYSITLLNSTGMDQRGNDINRRYNGWIGYLTSDIDDQLSRASL
jgi:hypothetical protein